MPCASATTSLASPASATSSVNTTTWQQERNIRSQGCHRYVLAWHPQLKKAPQGAHAWPVRRRALYLMQNPQVIPPPLDAL